MNKLLPYMLLTLFVNPVMADMIFVSSIPLHCSETEKTLNDIEVPGHFQLNPYQALLLASNVQGGMKIKKCGSKFEQVIYRDNERYYFFNSIEYMQSKIFPVNKPKALPKHIVIIDARTGNEIK